jgi:hypothetical protein
MSAAVPVSLLSFFFGYSMAACGVRKLLAMADAILGTVNISAFFSLLM